MAAVSTERAPSQRPPRCDGALSFRHTATMRAMVKRVLLASPRCYCAGVERAVETVERALEHYGAPVYVRKQIVHNLHVVQDLESQGAVFVDQETEVPDGAVVVLSAPYISVAPSPYRYVIV